MLTSIATGPMGDAPEFSFGSSKRFPDSGTGDPGPGQYMQSTTRVGGSLLGDAPKYGFGTSAQRDGGKGNRYISKEHSIKSGFGKASPGPMAYKMSSGLGEVNTGTSQPNSPRYTMRPRLVGYNPMGGGPGVLDLPAPGSYKADPAIGVQVRSARNSAAQYSFTQAGRHRPELQPKKTQYIGKDYEKMNWGIHSPGPQVYSTANAPTSYKVTPSYTFSQESRF